MLKTRRSTDGLGRRKVLEVSCPINVELCRCQATNQDDCACRVPLDAGPLHKDARSKRVAAVCSQMVGSASPTNSEVANAQRVRKRIDY